MDECLFCKITAGKLPAHVVYEDDNYIAFLDIHPLVPGHTLLIPKKHYRWVDDVETFSEYWEAAKKIATAMRNASMADFVSYLTYGLDVPHAHIHILPRKKNDEQGIVPSHTKMSEGDLRNYAQKIRSALS